VIAPIYNSIKIKDKNSISNKNKIKHPVKIIKTKLKIEYKAFVEKITITTKKRTNHTKNLKRNI
jgi:hypothetical protein